MKRGIVGSISGAQLGEIGVVEQTSVLWDIVCQYLAQSLVGSFWIEVVISLRNEVDDRRFLVLIIFKVISQTIVRLHVAIFVMVVIVFMLCLFDLDYSFMC